MVSVYVEAPEEGEQFLNMANVPSVFLAGGITGCPDWQTRMTDMLGANVSVVIYNPRRAKFPIDDPDAALEQITWEHNYLRGVDAILFWFPKETLCPIVLYELGAWSMTDKPIVVGTHPLYRRKQDVEIQTNLARPDVKVLDSLELLADSVNYWLKQQRGV
jgi:hypothetical protein